MAISLRCGGLFGLGFGFGFGFGFGVRFGFGFGFGVRLGFGFGFRLDGFVFEDRLLVRQRVLDHRIVDDLLGFCVERGGFGGFGQLVFVGGGLAARSAPALAELLFRNGVRL